jgi:hypothetical protein
MNENLPATPIGPLEMLAEWEGPAVHEPGVLFDPNQDDGSAGEGKVTTVASWISATVLSCPTDHAAYEAIKNKVLGFLHGWRQRHGQAKLEEVKQEIMLRMLKRRDNGKRTDADWSKRIESLFNEIPN